jgi:hypothetical protein
LPSPSRSDTVYAIQREREMGERKVKIKIESPTSNRSHGIICERSLVFRMKAANECDIEVQQQVRGQKERQRTMSETRGKLKKGATSLG